MSETLDNQLRERLRRGEPTLGCFVGLGSPSVTELLAHSGFDWLVIEAEHTPLGMTGVEQLLRATNGTSVAPLVRVPVRRPDFVQLALDAGARGVVIPMVRSYEEALALVRMTRYPPEGDRSFGPLRASKYGIDREIYFQTANENVITALIIETREALDELEKIASIPGVDALYLGPMDLSLSLGLDPFAVSQPELEEAVDRVLRVGRNAGVAIGDGAATPEEIYTQLKRGITMIGYGPDYRLLRTAAAAGVAAFRAQAARHG